MADESQKSSKQPFALDFVGICKSFGSHLVLNDINISLEAGQSLCVYGPNAVGKTTLLQIAAGLVRANAGKVTISGLDLHEQPQKASTLIGYISHKPMVYPQLTVLENLRFFADLYGVAEAQQRIEQLMIQSGLDGYRYDRASVLSRGMLQRLAIARAMVHQPSVLLADEPFTGLDADASRYLIGVFNDFTDRGRSILMTTHNVGLSLQCCRSVAVLEAGSFIFNSETSQVDTAAFTTDYLAFARSAN